MNISRVIALFLTLAVISSCEKAVVSNGADPIQAPIQPIQVLDGDTFIIGPDVVRLAGVDAPELAPMANCWAEAALATRAKVIAESELNAAGTVWRVVEHRGHNDDGHLIASLKNADGDDLGAILVVRGVAAAQEDWDWCAVENEFDAEGQPTIWAGPRLDPRALD
jgi:endonuclease YncB( thermonuclease family)